MTQNDMNVPHDDSELKKVDDWPLNHVIADACLDMRCDRWLRQKFPRASGSMIHKWIRSGQVRIDGGRCRSMQRLKGQQTIRVPPQAKHYVALPKVELSDSICRQLEHMLIHQTSDLFVFNKPTGLAVQGGTGIKESLDVWLSGMSTCSFQAPGNDDPVLVHRLDQEASGIIVVARDRNCARKLMPLFRDQQIKKAYLAIAHGNTDKDEGLLSTPIFRISQVHDHHHDAPGFTPDNMSIQNARSAETQYYCLAKSEKASLLLLLPSTGRKHQIRIHCARIGNGIWGDSRHGDLSFRKTDQSCRLMLHAFAVQVPPPCAMDICVASPPDDFVEHVQRLGLAMPSADELATLCQKLWV